MDTHPPMMKVLTPVENKHGKTYWIRIGNAFTNRDNSINVYLNAYPTSGKLQLRELDERDHRDYRDERDHRDYQDRPSSTSKRGTADGYPAGSREQEDLPF